MRVIVLMARLAVGRSFLLVEWPGVAAFARRRSMGSQQRVFGVPFVVEADGFPCFLAVTLLARISEV